MTHQWQQFDHHSEHRCELSDDEQKALIKAWQQSGSFEDNIKEIMSKENCHDS